MDDLGIKQKDFDDYVDKFSKKHGLTHEEAKREKIVKEVYEYYKENEKDVIVRKE